MALLTMSMKLAGFDDPDNHFQNLLAKLGHQNYANLPKNEIELMNNTKSSEGGRKISTTSSSGSSMSLDSIESLSQNDRALMSSSPQTVDEGIWSSNDKSSSSDSTPTKGAFLPRDLIKLIDIEDVPARRVKRNVMHLEVKEFFNRFRQQTTLTRPTPSPSPPPVNDVKVMYGSRDILDFESNVKDSTWKVTHPWMPANQVWSPTEITDSHRTCTHCNHHLAPQIGKYQQQNICQMVKHVIAMDN